MRKEGTPTMEGLTVQKNIVEHELCVQLAPMGWQTHNGGGRGEDSVRRRAPPLVSRAAMERGRSSGVWDGMRSG